MPPLDVEALQAPPAPPALDAGSIHVWIHDTGETLPRAVREVARASLGRLLCGYAGTDVAPTIETGEHGKPFAPALPGLEFNLSHAGSYAAFAFALGQPVGIDIELLERRISVDGIAARFFGERETAALARVDARRRQEAFLRLWTHKEAVLKALGDGLAFGLDRIEFELAVDGRVEGLARAATEAGAPSAWRLWPFEPSPGLVGCLAWRGAPRSVRRFAFVP